MLEQMHKWLFAQYSLNVCNVYTVFLFGRCLHTIYVYLCCKWLYFHVFDKAVFKCVLSGCSCWTSWGKDGKWAPNMFPSQILSAWMKTFALTCSWEMCSSVQFRLWTGPFPLKINKALNSIRIQHWALWAFVSQCKCERCQWDGQRWCTD